MRIVTEKIQPPPPTTQNLHLRKKNQKEEKNKGRVKDWTLPLILFFCLSTGWCTNSTYRPRRMFPWRQTPPPPSFCHCGSRNDRLLSSWEDITVTVESALSFLFPFTLFKKKKIYKKKSGTMADFYLFIFFFAVLVSSGCSNPIILCSFFSPLFVP